MALNVFKLCISCNTQVHDAIFNDTFFSTLAIMLSALIVLAVVIYVIDAVGKKCFEKIRKLHPDKLNPVPLTTVSLILGVGIGGFIDGIIFHQILQWHEMVSNKISTSTVVGKSVNMFWDGIFHIATLAIVVGGIMALWKIGKQTGVSKDGRLLFGGIIAGWGLFNCVEGIINHKVAGLHNVREYANQNEWNNGFLLLSFLLIGLGALIIETRKKEENNRN
jgi:uncharacterized membrane protein